MTPLPTQSTATDAPAADPVFGLMTPAESAAEDQGFDKVFREASGETEAAEEEKSAEDKSESKIFDFGPKSTKIQSHFGGFWSKINDFEPKSMCPVQGFWSKINDFGRKLKALGLWVLVDFHRFLVDFH